MGPLYKTAYVTQESSLYLQTTTTTTIRSRKVILRAKVSKCLTLIYSSISLLRKYFIFALLRAKHSFYILKCLEKKIKKRQSYND